MILMLLPSLLGRQRTDIYEIVADGAHRCRRLASSYDS